MAPRLRSRSVARIALLRIVRRSIDARGRQRPGQPRCSRFMSTVSSVRPKSGSTIRMSGHRTPVVVVGSGPAGLFAALRLIELRPANRSCWSGAATCRRASATSRRSTATARSIPIPITHSAKAVRVPIPTASSSPVPKSAATTARALEVFRFHGADESILYDAHPHIGTDRLPRIIAAMRRTYCRCRWRGVVRCESDRRADQRRPYLRRVARRYAGRRERPLFWLRAILRAISTKYSTATACGSKPKRLRWGCGPSTRSD